MNRTTRLTPAALLAGERVVIDLARRRRGVDHTPTWTVSSLLLSRAHIRRVFAFSCEPQAGGSKPAGEISAEGDQHAHDTPLVVGLARYVPKTYPLSPTTALSDMLSFMPREETKSSIKD